MGLDMYLRRKMFDTFDELLGAWQELGVPYTVNLSVGLERSSNALHAVWRVTVRDPRVEGMTVLPGFEDLTISPVRAEIILRAALGSARMALEARGTRETGTARDALAAEGSKTGYPHLTLVRDE